MTDAEKIKVMAQALNDLNKIIYANTIICGTPDYFKARAIVVDTLNKVGERVT